MWRPLLLLVSLAMSLTSPAIAGPLRVTALFEWQRGPARESYTGFVLLEVPFERLARPLLPATPTGGKLWSLTEDAGSPPPVEKRPARPLALQSRPLPVKSVRRLVRAALEHGFDVDGDERLGGLASRMRAAAVLPELSLRAARSTNESLRLSPNGTLVNDYTQTGGAGLIFEARATWRLDRLVFADDEIHVERLRVERERARERVVELLLKHLFAWQRARSRLLTNAETLTEEERALVEAELDGARAALDILTDGTFSGELPLLEAANDAR